MNNQRLWGMNKKDHCDAIFGGLDACCEPMAELSSDGFLWLLDGDICITGGDQDLVAEAIKHCPWCAKQFWYIENAE